jgi:hypothetical protein
MFSPYARREAIHEPLEFFGRTAELSSLYGLIMQRQFAIVTGERRVGKSSLLNALKFKRDEFEVPDELTFIYIDGQYFGAADEEDFLEALLERFSRETGIPTLSPTTTSLRKASLYLAQQAAPPRLCIIMDEIDVVVLNRRIEPKLFSAMRAWAQEFGVAFVAATREGNMPRLLEAQGQGSPFWNLFRPVYVGPLKEEEVDELIATRALAAGTPFTEEEVKAINELGGRQPFFLQIACDHLFQLKTTHDRETNWQRRLMAEFRTEAMPHLEYLWERLSGAERQEVVTMATTGAVPEGDVRRELLRKGVVVSRGGDVSIFSSVLAESIRELDQRIRGLGSAGRNALLGFASAGHIPDRASRTALMRQGFLTMDQELRFVSPLIADVVHMTTVTRDGDASLL